MDLTGKLWIVTKYRSANGRLMSPAQTPDLTTKEMTVRFLSDEGRVSGTGCVNSFGGDYEAGADGSIAISGIASTKVRGAAVLVGQEDAFLRELESADSYRVSADSLELRDGAGVAVLRLRAGRAVPLEGTAWQCTSYNNGSEDMAPVLTGTEITAVFEGGALAGRAGVNRYQAEYTLDGGKLGIDKVAATTSSSGTALEMDQEGAYLAMLSEVVAFDISDDVLMLFDRGGGRLAAFEPAR